MSGLAGRIIKVNSLDYVVYNGDANTIFSQLSAVLESHETLPPPFSPISSVRYLRHEHAKLHSLNTLRTTFSLDIPSVASPAFQIRQHTCVSFTGNTEHHTCRAPWGWIGKSAFVCSSASFPKSSFSGIQGVRFKALVRDEQEGNGISCGELRPLMRRWRNLI